jgi:hypothetical protein
MISKDYRICDLSFANLLCGGGLCREEDWLLLRMEFDEWENDEIVAGALLGHMSRLLNLSAPVLYVFQTDT